MTEYLTASEMKDRANKSTKVSDIAELAKIFTDKIFEQMVASADKHNYRMEIDIEIKHRKINLAQNDCDIVASQIRDYLICKGYSTSKYFIERSDGFDVYGRFWLYRLTGRVSWE